MTIETRRAIARITATAIVKERGKDVDSLEVADWLEGELPGLESDQFNLLADMTLSYVRSSEVEVYIKDYMVRDDGSLKTADDLKAEMSDGDKVSTDRW